MLRYVLFVPASNDQLRLSTLHYRPSPQIAENCHHLRLLHLGNVKNASADAVRSLQSLTALEDLQMQRVNEGECMAAIMVAAPLRRISLRSSAAAAAEVLECVLRVRY